MRLIAALRLLITVSGNSRDGVIQRSFFLRMRSGIAYWLGATSWLLLLMFSAWPLPLAAASGCSLAGPNPAFGFGRDDLNISDLTPCPAEVLAGQGSTTGGSDWIMTALNANGYVPGNGWNFHYADPITALGVSADLTILYYYPRVIDEPDVAAPSGRDFPGRVRGVDAGGAIFGLAYTPEQVGNPPVNEHLHWVQARVRFEGETTRIENFDLWYTPRQGSSHAITG